MTVLGGFSRFLRPHRRRAGAHPAAGPAAVVHAVLALRARRHPGGHGDLLPARAGRHRPRRSEPPHRPQARGGAVTALVETKGVSKHYGAFHALQDVSIAVSAGEFVSVVGPNGAGKTTLVNLLTGLLVPTAGEVYFKGGNIAGVGPWRSPRAAWRAPSSWCRSSRSSPWPRPSPPPSSRARASGGGMFSACLADLDVRARVAEIAGIFGLAQRLDATSRMLSQGEEAARRRLRLRARPAGDPARRADLGRVDRRKARHDENADRRGQGGRRQGHHPGRARHGPGGGLLASHHRAGGRPGAGRPAAGGRSSPIRLIIETVVGKRRREH